MKIFLALILVSMLPLSSYGSYDVILKSVSEDGSATPLNKKSVGFSSSRGGCRTCAYWHSAKTDENGFRHFTDDFKSTSSPYFMSKLMFFVKLDRYYGFRWSKINEANGEEIKMKPVSLGLIPNTGTPKYECKAIVTPISLQDSQTLNYSVSVYCLGRKGQ